MHSHLDIKVNGKSLVIPDDSSLSAEEKNPLFNDVTFFSYPMKIPVEGNREVLKNIAHRDSDMRAMDLEHADARIYADGLPLNHGQVITQDGSEIKDTFEFNIDAQQQSFSELIGDLECQDVKVKDRLVIGEKIGDIRFTGRIYLEERRTIYEENWVITDDPTYVGDVALNTLNKRKDFIIDSPQALGFSIPAKAKGFPVAEHDSNDKLKLIESYINVSQPYGSIVNSPYKDESGATLGWPFCNARVAYAHPDVKENDDGTKETEGTVKGNAKGAEKEDYGQYWCLDADRPQSGICFYVLYFLDCLFHQLGVVFNKDELMEVEDLKRLCFFTTVCHFDEDDTDKTLRNDEIQQWLDSRNCGGKVGFGINTGKTKKREDDAKSLPHVDFFKFEPMDYRELEEKYTFPIGEPFESREMFDYYDFYNYFPDVPVPRLLHVQYYRNMEGYFDVSTTIHEMVANSENFPKDSVSNVISSLEASFGIRFLYDPEKKTVTARLLRNIYKTKGVRQFEGQVLSMTPKNEKITGVRVLYSAESDKKEQKNNVRYGVKDYDTEFDYIEFPQDRTITDLTYNDITGQVNSTNRRVYIDQTTGDVYRIKIDSEAKDMFSLHPVLFRVAQYKGIEIGDCSEKNESYVKEFSSGFQPLTVSIINAMDYNDDRTGEVSPIFAPLLEVDMEHEYLPMYIESATDVDTDELRGSCAFPNHVGLALREELSLAESYDPTQTDDGNSPLQEIDWGLTVAIMRGGGAGSEIVEFDRGYDGFDNSRWKDVVGIYAMYSDSLDPKGAMFGYSGEQFSLSVRAWVQPEWADAPMCADDDRDQQGHIVHRIRSRGTADAFMAEHIHALLNRKPFKVEVQATVAQLLDIRNHWEDKYVLDGKVGFINAVKYNIERATGVGESELEFYAL